MRLFSISAGDRKIMNRLWHGPSSVVLSPSTRLRINSAKDLGRGSSLRYAPFRMTVAGA
jgi:hypothetical protein